MPSGPTATSVFGPRGKRGRQNRETGTVVFDQASLVRKWPSRLSLLPYVVSAVIKEHSRENHHHASRMDRLRHVCSHC
ncbi:hypothetical protein I314_01908 [Cryptococcus bacillisporus CA1873]|uniref:Uncharacterized protein n=1 Tax=Cryptococcus bacillisporus CA1873 TaxID=1296111 RepID=A0ABR5BET2_CRYGA|nr:hypothetical protein I314_01908 [Cryptococcus bacillisporus CA1873]|eukprot:KIR67492.1 hypothetical protein I314_01908 [Cryptococcus gattii CA1873]